MCSLEHAHWRLSALPAHCAGFRDRGTLVEGAPADVVVYDFERSSACRTEVAHDFPGGEWRRIQRARGYRYVLVNGEVTIEDDRETARTRAGCCGTGRWREIKPLPLSSRPSFSACAERTQHLRVVRSWPREPGSGPSVSVGLPPSDDPNDPGSTETATEYDVSEPGR